MCAGRGPVADLCKPCVCCFSLCELMWVLRVWIWRVLFSWCPPSPLALRLRLLFYQVCWALMGFDGYISLRAVCSKVSYSLGHVCLWVSIFVPDQLQEEASLIMVGNSIIFITFILWELCGPTRATMWPQRTACCILSFHHVGPGAQIQVPGLSRKCLYLLSRLAGPAFQLLKWCRFMLTNLGTYLWYIMIHEDKEDSHSLMKTANVWWNISYSNNVSITFII